MKKYILLLILFVGLILCIKFPILFSYFTISYFLIISLIAFTYKPFKEKCICTCDVLIPVYNEGKHIYKTIKSINKSYYKNFKIIVIDDGSNDDTKYWIEQSILKYNNIDAIYFEKNKGKKYALAEGFKKSKADIIITIDSDSIINKKAIQNILKPFNNEKIGAVAGNINVKNINLGLIPKLMDIIFIFSYELLRSSQSKFGVVLCTPGALSAYRRNAIIPILDKWLNQKFLGKDTIIGEDRALTSLLIKNNWQIVYQESAKAYTNMPIYYKDLCKMLLRWVRGDIRENILMFEYVFKNFNILNLKSICLFFHYIIFNIGILSPIILLPILILYYIFNISQFIIILPYICIIMLLFSIIPMIIYMRKKSILYSIHSITYSIFSLLFLSWIPFYAILTLKNNNWLTRK